MKRSTVTMLACLLATAAPGLAQAPSGPPPDPRDTDPVKLGWMVGSPPPADKMIRARRRQLLPIPAVALELLALARARADGRGLARPGPPSASCRARSARISTP